MIIILLFLILILVSGLFYWLFMSPYSQIFGKFVWKVKTDKKQIALTFDDGPNEPYTSELLDFLKDNNVRATFFIVGEDALKYPDLVKRINKEGHLIGNHSLSHKYRNYFIQPNFSKETIKSQEILEDITGKKPTYQRSPWLFRSPLIFRTLKNNGLTPISGEFCHPLEVFGANPKTISTGAIKKAKPGAIIIFHDGNGSMGGDRSNSIEASKIFIKNLLNQGYEFLTVDELLAKNN